MRVEIKGDIEDMIEIEIGLDVKDYTRLFKEEIAFGKLLLIFDELSKIIMENPDRFRSWLSDSRYSEIRTRIRELAILSGVNSNELPF